MSIHKLANLNDDKAGNLLRNILNGLAFPSYLAPEELFIKVKEYRGKGLHEISITTIFKFLLRLRVAREK